MHRTNQWERKVRVDARLSRGRRKRIVRILEEQQALEADALRQIAVAVRECKESLLNTAGAWLLELTTANDHAEIASFSNMSVDRWQQLDRERCALAQALGAAEAAHTKLASEYRALAPFGFVSRMKMSGDQKGEMDRLGSLVNQANSDLREKNARNAEMSEEQIDMAATFMRDALASLGVFRRCPAVSSQVEEAMTKLNNQVADIWQSHRITTIGALSLVGRFVERMLRDYQGSGAPNLRLPGGGKTSGQG